MRASEHTDLSTQNKFALCAHSTHARARSSQVARAINPKNILYILIKYSSSRFFFYFHIFAAV